jgi:hypothetical protein
MTKEKKQKMNAKNLMVTFVLALFLLAGFATVSAADVDFTKVRIDDVAIGNAQVTAGEDVTVEVWFKSNETLEEVVLEAEIDAKKDVEVSSAVFTMLAGEVVKKTFVMTIPSELKDELNDELELTLKLDDLNGKDYEITRTFSVLRLTYNAEVKSVVVPSSITAGETFPVEFVLKNMGYNELEDLYVSAAISELDVVYGPKWVGDLVCFEECDDDCDEEDTVMGRLYLDVPYSAAAGVYTLEILVENDDTETRVVKKIVIANDFTKNVLSTSTAKAVAVGEEAVYELLIVNPTNNVKVYNIVTESEEVISSASQAIVAVPAGSSKTVTVAASSDVEGAYTFNVNVFEGENLASTVAYNLVVEGKATNTVFVLTIVLAAVFLILLVALIVLLGKKPEKTEEFGESYY